MSPKKRARGTILFALAARAHTNGIVFDAYREHVRVQLHWTAMLETGTDHLRGPSGVQRLQFDDGPARRVLVQGVQKREHRVHIHHIPPGSGHWVHGVEDLDRVHQQQDHVEKVRRQDRHVRRSLSDERGEIHAGTLYRRARRGRQRRDDPADQRAQDRLDTRHVPQQPADRVFHAHVRAEPDRVRGRSAVLRALHRSVHAVPGDQRGDVRVEDGNDRREPVPVGPGDDGRARNETGPGRRWSVSGGDRNAPPVGQRHRAAEAEAQVHEQRRQKAERAVRHAAGNVPVGLVSDDHVRPVRIPVPGADENGRDQLLLPVDGPVFV